MPEQYEDKVWLHEQFQEGRGFSDIAKTLGVHVNTIRYWARKFGIAPLNSKMNVNVGLNPLDIKELPDIINRAGGVSKWAQGELIEMYAFLKNLAYKSFDEDANVEGSKYILKALDKITELIPSRSRRETDDFVKRIAPEDKEVVNKLNGLLPLVGKDINFGDNEEGWYEAGERVPVKLPHADDRNR
jgi:hypothetical protein